MSVGVKCIASTRGMTVAFWDSAIKYFWREESTLVLVMILSLAFLLFHFHREERHSILNPLGFFFARLTGEPRVASVLALTDIECYRLDKEAFEKIMQARPSIAEEVSHILVERRTQLDSAMQNMGEGSLHKVVHHQENDVLATIKRFFGL